jgi:hypothetical protein
MGFRFELGTDAPGVFGVAPGFIIGLFNQP